MSNIMTPHEFYLKTIGKAIDRDGYYGAQCWDLFDYFNGLMGYPRINCTTTGYVKDIANNMNSNGILKNYDSVAKNEKMQDGDWIVWGEVPQSPYSHITMIRKIDGKDSLRSGEYIVTVLGQNQAGTQKATQIQMSTYGALRIFRPKAYVKEVAQVKELGYLTIPKSGTFQFSVDSVRIRTKPSIQGVVVKNAKNEELCYGSGMKVNYVNYHHADGYTWIEYNRSVGGKAYVAICDKNGNNWGKVL